MKVKKSP